MSFIYIENTQHNTLKIMLWKVS